MGATRVGMTHALVMNALLTEDVRQEFIQALVQVLSADNVSFGGSFALKNHLGLSSKFIERAKDIFQIATSEEDIPQLNIRTRFAAQVTLSGRGKHVQQDRTVGLSIPTESGTQALTVLVPSMGLLWPRKRKSLRELVETLNEDRWLAWQTHFQEAPETDIETPALSRIAGTYDLFPLLPKMELGPGITPSADFSLMMASGNAPYLTGLRHGFNLTTTASQRSESARPLLWFLTDTASGLILALGVHHGDAA